ncbi:MAG: hypothetical protein CL678_16550 [Bdellovibrionaceae bacterium]|nr:hypothetical protein [Pseudobdellovibrionaceae bacterium]|tara:strand:- start:2069 stop:2824 length:756 start_codon:yes stop_codon:yes gene_type:complete
MNILYWAFTLFFISGSISYAEEEFDLESHEESPQAQTETKAQEDLKEITEDTETSPVSQDLAYEYDPRIPRHLFFQPNMGLSIYYSPNALGDSVLGAGKKMSGVSLEYEYQPVFFQKFGVLGFGPNISLYPTTPVGAVSDQIYSNFSVGAQVTYQLRYFDNQPFVPFARYRAEYWNYNLKSVGKGRFLAHGPAAGGMFFLNWFDEHSANGFYQDWGVLRSYLVGEVRFLKGEDANFLLDAQSYFFGLRMEF